MLLSVHALEGSAPRRRPPNISGDDHEPPGDRAGKQDRRFIGAQMDHCLRDWSIGSGYELRQLGAGVDAELGERIVDVVFHRMEGKVQLCGDRLVGGALGDQVDDRELGVGEAVPARFGPRLGDNAPLHTEPAQLAAHPARIGQRLRGPCRCRMRH